MPKRGFNNIFAKSYEILTLGRLQKAIDATKIDISATVAEAVLKAAGLVRNSREGVRLLGKGELTAKVKLDVTGASKSAIAAVEKAGGSIIA